MGAVDQKFLNSLAAQSQKIKIKNLLYNLGQTIELIMKTIATLLALAAAAVSVVAHPASLMQKWSISGHSQPEEQVSFSLHLPMRNTEKLDSAFWAISTPGTYVARNCRLMVLFSLTITNFAQRPLRQVLVSPRSYGYDCCS